MAITGELRAHFRINDQEVGRSDFNQLQSMLLQLIQHNFDSFRDSMTEGNWSVRRKIDENATPIYPIPLSSTSDILQLFQYCGSFHMLPQDFEFPTCCAQRMWSMWHLGIRAQSIGPLKNLRTKYRMDVPASKRPLIDKAGLVVDGLKAVAVKLGILGEYQIVGESNYNVVWNGAFREYLSLIYTDDQLKKESR